MGIDDELEALGALQARHRRSRVAEVVLAVKLAAMRRRTEAYAACFLDESGELTPAAQLVLADLARQAGLGTAARALSDAALREQHGARRVVLHLIDSLRVDPVKMRRLARKIRETKSND